MFRFLMEKMLKNRWLTVSLLIGYVIAIAVISSLPLYSNAILNRMLRKDLEYSQTQTGIYPGRVSSQVYLTGGKEASASGLFHQYDRFLQDEILPSLTIPAQEGSVYTAAQSLQLYRSGYEQSGAAKACALAACSGLFDQITLLDGTLPSSEEKDGVCEVIVSERAAYRLDLVLGSVYDLYQPKKLGDNEERILLAKVKITGVYTAEDLSSLYWVMPFSTFDSSLMLEPSLFAKKFMETDDAYFNYAQWAYAMDYTKLTVPNSQKVSDAVTYYAGSGVYPPKLEAAFVEILSQYELRRQQLEGMLWVIQVPILLMLLFYIFMVTRLILEHEQTEIAVLRNRGAFRRQITGIYMGQAGILALLALMLGPLLSMLFCQLIGASNGFLEFVSRKALPLAFSTTAFLFAAATAAALVLTMLCSILFKREGSIVAVKRKKSGRRSAPLWQKLFLDAVCLAVSLYGLYSFRNRLTIMEQTGISASEVPIDFLLYGSSTLFILGAALLFLRIFPYIIRLIYRIGRKHWGPVLYLTLLNISRSGAGNQIISLFLIFTLSMGVFNAVTVRTINQNGEDRINYSIGADIVVQEKWKFTGGHGGSAFNNADLPPEIMAPIHYTEPLFSRYQNMETVENVARVRAQENVSMTAGTTKEKVTLMGIIPDEFGRVCWFRSDLLSHHINEYLNLLAQEPQAVLLSQSFMDENGISPGDTIYLTVGNRNTSLGSKTGFPFIVYAGIDYFPSINPRTEDGEKATLVVANLSYLETLTEISPYQVWMKKAEGATSAMVYGELEEMGIQITSLENADADIIDMKNDAMTQGLNGYFTLSFLVTMLVTFVGFFIYWILTIKGRMLQFGILRSMGLSRLSVILVLFWEQILVSVTAILAGLGLGTLTAQLFGPILESNVDLSEQVLPFLVVAFPEDYGRIALVVGIMLVIAAIVLSRIICRLRINEALKLGED